MSELIVSNMPWVWLGVCVLLLIIEALTTALTTIWGAASALVLVFLSTLNIPIRWQLIIFLVLTIVLVVTTRPIFLRKMKEKRTNVDNLLGQEVKVTKTITKFEKGLAETRNGVSWTATSEDESEIKKGSVCIISSVEGNTLKLKLKED